MTSNDRPRLSDDDLDDVAGGTSADTIIGGIIAGSPDTQAPAYTAPENGCDNPGAGL